MISKVAVIRFIAAILASWAVRWLAQGRVPGPLVEGLAFWVMFLILPITFSGAGPETFRTTSFRRVLAATAGATLVLILTAILLGWQ